MPYFSTFGTLLSRGQVAQAVINTLQSPPASSSSVAPLIVHYLAEVERQQGLIAKTIFVPPDVASYRVGLDFEMWAGDQLPTIIVLCEPLGDAERYNAGTYGQMYQVEVGAIVEAQDEPSAILLADQYGAALSGALAQNGGMGTRTYNDGSIGTFAENTRLMSSRTEFLQDTERRFCRSVVTLHLMVQDVIQEQRPTYNVDPYTAPGAWPNVSTVDVQLQAETPTGVFNTSTGVNVTDAAGHVTVNE